MLEVSFAEAEAIIARQDARAEIFYENRDAQLVAAVQRAFEKRYPGELQLGGVSPEIEQAMADSLKDAPDMEQGAVTPTEIESSLRNDWGAAFETNLSRAANTLETIFGDADTFQNFLDTHDISPAHQIQVVKLLAQIGGKR